MQNPILQKFITRSRIGSPPQGGKFITTQKEVAGMTDKLRLTVTLPPELEADLIELKKSDKYVRSSFSEIIRDLLTSALATVKGESA